MKNIFKSLALAFGVAALSASAMAQDSGPLLDALVKKGVLSDNEAEDIRVNLVKEYNTTSAGKLQIASFVKKLQLFGDARLRYQYQDLQSPRGGAAINGGGQMVDTINNRYRYRLRAGATYTYDSHWSATVRLETAAPNDSTNADFGNYWDKRGTDGTGVLSVGQVFLDYKTKFSVFDSSSTVPSGKSFTTVTDPGVDVGLNVRVGRGPKQIYLTEAFWDSDLNPEGIATELTFNNVGFDGLSFAARGAAYVTDNDNVAAGQIAADHNQIVDDDGGLLIAQIEGAYKVTGGYFKGTEVRIAPLYLQETGGDSNGFGAAATIGNGSSAQGVAGNANGTPLGQGNLKVIAVPAEVNFSLWKQSHKVYGTYGVNLDSNNRLHEMYAPGIAGFTGNHGQNTFWNVGYELGKLKKQGDWMFGAEWRWIEAASYTGALSDSDWANNALNVTGSVVSAGYNLTDAITLKTTWFHSTPIQAGRGGYNANNTVSANYTGVTTNAGTQDILQADISWKF